MKPLQLTEHLKFSLGDLKKDAKEFCDEAKAANSKTVLKAYIDATHSGRLTNLRVYPGTQMKASVDTWLKPSVKPVLKHHNTDADPIGKIFSADYVHNVHGPAWEKDYISPGDTEGSGFIRLGVEIMDADSIEKILDGRFRNVSTRQDVDSLSCSICGEDLRSYDSCEHRPGQTYKIGTKGNQQDYLCYGITGPLKYREVSLVSVPADAFAEIKSFNLQDSLDLDFYDTVKANVRTLVLTDGQTEVDLLSGMVNKITAKDRAALTGKTIIAVSPQFDASKNKENNMNLETNKTNADGAASAPAKDPAQETSKDSKKEGVVAPESDPKKTPTGNDSLSDKDHIAAVRALSVSLQAAETDAQKAKDESARLQTALKDKEDEITALRKQLSDQLVETKTAYASALIDSQIILKKSIVSSVKDAESYNAKMSEYAERSIESLKDSVKDLSIEMLELKDLANTRKSVKDLVADKQVTPPNANNIQLNSTTDSKGPQKKPDSKEALKNFLNN